MTLTTADDVRVALALRLNRQPREDVWGFLLKEGRVQAILEQGADQDEEALADDLARYYQSLEEGLLLAPLPRSKRSESKAVATRTPDAQTQWLARWLAVDAAEDPEVVSFRREVLDDRLLDVSAMQGWIERQHEQTDPTASAVRKFLMIAPESEEPYKKARDRALMGDGSSLNEQELLELGRTLFNDLRRRVVHEDGRSERSFISFDATTPYFSGQSNLLECDLETGRRMYVATGGVLDRLRLIARALCIYYPWRPADAVTFVLTGVPPRPLEHRAVVTWHPDYPALDRMELVLHRMVQPKQVAALYMEARRALQRTDQVHRPRYRQMEEKHLALAVFARRHEGEKNRDKLDAWNLECEEQGKPEWRYKPTQLANFSRDVKRATERLVGLA